MSSPEMRAGDGDPAMHAAAARAIDLITDGALVGLGSGRTASVFVRLLGARVRDGTSRDRRACLRRDRGTRAGRGIPLAPLTEDRLLDLTVDGADEVAPNLDLIKGHGGALVRERIIAGASKRQVIIVGGGKLVRRLGERFALPVEVIPFAAGSVTRAIKALGLHPRVATDATTGNELTNENGNLTFACAFREPLADAPCRASPRGVVARDSGRRRHGPLSRHRGTRAGGTSRWPRRHAPARRRRAMTPSVRGSVEVFSTRAELAAAAAERFIAAAGAAIGARSVFSVALSGGSTPRELFEALASPGYASRVLWPGVHVFWGDERCVPPEDEESNYRMARESLLDRVPVRAENVHRMRGEDDPSTAAGEYERDLRAAFGTPGRASH